MNAADTPRSAIDDPPTGPTRCCDRVVEDLELEELLTWVEALPPGNRTRFLQAHTLRFRAQIAGDNDLTEAERGFTASAALFREIGVPFYFARVQLEHAELLAPNSLLQKCAPLLAEAREVFDLLRATPWLERLDAVGSGAVTAV